MEMNKFKKHRLCTWHFKLLYLILQNGMRWCEHVLRRELITKIESVEG